MIEPVNRLYRGGLALDDTRGNFTIDLETMLKVRAKSSSEGKEAEAQGHA